MKFYKKYLLIIFTLISITLFTFAIFNRRVLNSEAIKNKNNENLKNTPYLTVKINNQEFKLKIADDENERRQGLSDLSNMKQDEGMIFVFSDEEIRNFWMKNMNFDLDIIYLNKNKEIVSIYRSVSKSTYDMQNPDKSKFINSIYPAKYAIELNVNVLEVYNLKLGDIVNF